MILKALVISLIMTAVIVLVIGPCVALHLFNELTWDKYKRFYKIIFK